MWYFIMIILAPILQIVLSALRINGRIKLSFAVIAFLCLSAGIILSIISGNLENYSVIQNMPGKKCLDCGMVGLSLIFVGILITMVSVPVIGLASYLYYKIDK